MLAIYSIHVSTINATKFVESITRYGLDTFYAICISSSANAYVKIFRTSYNVMHQYDTCVGHGV
jgi:hypothetical protein